ncbi:MAG: matrixin family metalloprotease [Pseudomonadota bacterium]
MRFLFSLTVLLALAGCGSKESVIARFALEPVGIPESQLVDISAILAEFNERLGSNLASLCSEDCTGVMELVSPREDGIVGLCEPSTYIRSKSRFSMSKGWTRQRKSELRADIKISSDLMNEGNKAFLRTIIFHELGHGLLLDHSSNEHDVMFAVVNGEKDFDRYFEQVRSKLQEISQ